MKPLEVAINHCGQADRVYSIMFTASGINVTVRDTQGNLVAECWGNEYRQDYRQAGEQAAAY